MHAEKEKGQGKIKKFAAKEKFPRQKKIGHGKRKKGHGKRKIVAAKENNSLKKKKTRQKIITKTNF